MTTTSRFRAAIIALAAAAAVVLAGVAPANATTAPGTVTGTVTDSGTAIGNIDVSWLIPSTGESNTVQTDVDGSYSLPLPTGTRRYYILVNADPGSSDRVNSSYLAEFFGARNAEAYAFQVLAPDTTRASFVLSAALETGGSVSGTSADLANQRVSLVSDGQGDDSGPYADSSGHFSFTGYAPGTYEIYAPAHGDFASYLSAPFALSNGQDLVLNPELPAGGEIEGTITESIPINLTVTVTGGDIIPNGGESTQVDPSGHYAFTDLSTGTFTVSVGGSDSTEGLYTEQGATVHLTAVGQSTTHDFSLIRGATITADPKMPTTDPNSDYSARLTDSSGHLIDETTRGYGPAFSFADVTPGTYTFDVADRPAGKWQSTTVVVGAGQALNLGEFDLTTKAIVLSGTVSGGKAGTIGLSEPNASGTLNYLSVAHFTSNGKYQVGSLLPGKYSVSIAVSGHEVTGGTITVTKSAKANYSIGPKLVPVTGTLLVEGARLQQSALDYSSASYQQLQLSVTNGALTGSAHSGTYFFGSTRFLGVQGDFQEKSAFYFAWSSSLRTLKLVAGHTTSLGTHSLHVVDGS